MRARLEEDLAPYLPALRAAPFVRDVEVRAHHVTRNVPIPYAVIRVKTPRGWVRLQAARTRTTLTNALAQAWLARIEKDARKNWILLAPYVPPGPGLVLREAGLCYADTAGNCHLAVGPEYMTLIEGRRPNRRTAEERPLGQTAYRVMFALLARPECLTMPVRDLAATAGAGKTVVAQLLRRLEADGLIAKGRGQWHLLQPERLLDRWIAGYGATLRPKLFVGRFRTQAIDPPAVEAHLEQRIGDAFQWVLGGGAAAMRLTGYYRGEETVLHIAEPPARLGLALGALADRNGPLVVLGTPGPLGMSGPEPRTAHPLLVYTELVNTVDPRAVEAGQMVREKYLQWIR